MNRSSLRPLVGVSACLKENGRGGWHHTVGDKYFQAAVRAVGALPVLIPAIGPEFDPQARLREHVLVHSDPLVRQWIDQRGLGAEGGVEKMTSREAFGLNHEPDTFGI